MGTLPCTDFPTPQVSRAWIQPAAVLLQSLAGIGGSCGLFDLATAVALLPACLGAAHTRNGECVKVSVRALMSCFNLMLRFDSQDEA